jgi:hypothetical protein
MTDAHHLGNTACIVLVRLDRPRRQKPLCVPRLNANGLEAGSNEVPMQPFGKRTGFRTHHIDLVMPKLKLLDERTGFAINFALPNNLAVKVEHTNSSFLKGDIEANNLAHGSLRS